MSVSLMRFGFVGFWLVVAGMVAARHTVAPDMAARGDDRQMDLIAMIAVGLAAWNLFRWYAGRKAGSQPVATNWPAGRRPLEPRGGDRVEEYNPELDFIKKPDQPKP